MKFNIDNIRISNNIQGERKMERIIKEELLEQYRISLHNEEKSPLTISKYVRDVRKIMEYASDFYNIPDDKTDIKYISNNGLDNQCQEAKKITKELVIAFKNKLYNEDHYKIESVNSIIEAVNRFFDYMKWYDLKVKTYRVQRESFMQEKRYMSKEEYRRLLAEAKRRGNKRLYLILETLASTGMRVSELAYVTMEAVRTGTIEVNNKGKIRKVLITKKLQTQLTNYYRENGIEEGIIFRTRTGKLIDRTNIWKEMKNLCEAAGVEKSKVYPHSLRKLFARSLYKIQKDIAIIADILGHSNIETTRRYVRETSREHRRLLERMQLVGGYW